MWLSPLPRSSLGWRVSLITGALIALALAIFSAAGTRQPRPLRIGIAALLVIGGGVIGGVMARRISTALLQLAAEAEGLSSGQPVHHLAAMDRDDEVGRLARALETSGAVVREMLDRLESDVDARSEELSSTVERLRLAHDELRQQEHFAVVGRTSGAVGHELRNPLGVMNTVVRLLEAVPEASPKVRNYAAMLREQIRLSERIIAELLDRARAGESITAIADPARLVRELIEVLPAPSSILIRVDEPELAVEVVLDRDRVWQVLWNLVTNAIQSIEGDGGVGEVRIAIRVDTQRLVYEVGDSGPGVAPELRDRIFEPLFTTKRAGIGLGLAICRAYARSQGGDLHVHATGRGSCFTFELPVISPDRVGLLNPPVRLPPRERAQP